MIAELFGHSVGQIVESFDSRDRFELLECLGKEHGAEVWRVRELGSMRVGDTRYFSGKAEEKPDWTPF